MRRRTLGTALWLALVVAGVGATQQATFRSGVDLVTFGVTVVDRDGHLVTDLTADDFTVVEDGAPQTVRYFAVGDEADERAKKRLGLMLDTSESMEQDLKLARTAAIKFLNMLPEAEDITLVDFDTEVRVSRYPQRDFARLVERIRMREPEGWTALYDALGVYLDSAQLQDGRKILVMYTDGGDTRSTIGFGDLLTLLKASQVTVYAVGLTENTGSYRTELRMRLQQIVEATGGQAFFPSRLKDLDEAYADVLAEIKARYHLGYASTNLAEDGSWRDVEIKVKRKGVKVRTRKGYFAVYRSQH
ncbi:MAG: VWA domain-containing protein [Vicinamibacterales bacterium]